MSAEYTPAERAIMGARCPDYFEEVGCDGPDGCAECIAAVRRSAITEAVDRLTDGKVRSLVAICRATESSGRFVDLTIPDFREALRRALTEGT